MKKIFAAIANVWHMLLGQSDRIVIENLDEAVRVAGTIKNILSGSVAGIITALIPGDADDKLVRTIVARLDAALQAVTPHMDEIKDMTPEARIEYLVQWLRNLYGKKEVPGGLIRDIAARYLQQSLPKAAQLEDYVANAVVENKVFNDLFQKKEPA